MRHGQLDSLGPVGHWKKSHHGILEVLRLEARLSPETTSTVIHSRTEEDEEANLGMVRLMYARRESQVMA